MSCISLVVLAVRVRPLHSNIVVIICYHHDFSERLAHTWSVDLDIVYNIKKQSFKSSVEDLANQLTLPNSRQVVTSSGLTGIVHEEIHNLCLATST